MKVKIVPLSKILKNKKKSLAPEDYIDVQD
jgi:hypothetical protein